MQMTRRPLRRMTAIRAWPLWSLPRWLTAFIIVVVALNLAAVGIAAYFTTITEKDLGLFVFLLVCMVLAVELSKKGGEQGGVWKDVQGVWELPVAILLPPVFALIVPIARITMTQLRVRRGPLHRRVFTGAAVGLSYGAASVTFHGLSGLLPQDSGGSLVRSTAWTFLVLLSALVKWALNKAMIMTAVKGANPTENIRVRMLAGEKLYNDAAEICVGVLVTYGVAGNPLLALVALPVVTLLQRSLAERGNLGTRIDGGDRPRRPDQDADGGGAAGHRQVQGDQRHLRSPGRRSGHQGDRPHARRHASRLRSCRTVRRGRVLAAVAADASGGRAPHRGTCAR